MPERVFAGPVVHGADILGGCGCRSDASVEPCLTRAVMSGALQVGLIILTLGENPLGDPKVFRGSPLASAGCVNRSIRMSRQKFLQAGVRGFARILGRRSLMFLFLLLPSCSCCAVVCAASCAPSCAATTFKPAPLLDSSCAQVCAASCAASCAGKLSVFEHILQNL